MAIKHHGIMAGCCAAAVYTGYLEENNLPNSISSATFIVVSDDDLKKLSWLKDYPDFPKPIKMDNLNLHILSQNHLNVIKNRPLMKIHEELQKRDGRKLWEFKTGDRVKLLNAATFNVPPYSVTLGPTNGDSFLLLLNGGSYHDFRWQYMSPENNFVRAVE